MLAPELRFPIGEITTVQRLLWERKSKGELYVEGLRRLQATKGVSLREALGMVIEQIKMIGAGENIPMVLQAYVELYLGDRAEKADK